MSISPFRGVGTALVTPFGADGAVDYACLRRLVDFQVENGVDFLVPLGTTGESATLNGAEHLEITKVVLEQARGRVPVLVGCGGNNTQAVIERGLTLKALGVRHILSVSPYYTRPTQEGLVQHFRAIRQQTGLEILLYNIQARTGSNVETPTVARLFQEGLIFGVKEASGNLQQIQKVCQALGADFQVFSGDDALTLPIMAVGGVGAIAVASNVIPHQMSQWVKTMAQGDFAAGRAQLSTLLPLFEALSAEVNPIPIKGAAQLLGLMALNYRLPLVPPTQPTLDKLREALQPFRV